MDAKLRYKAKKIKIVFFDIDDTLRNSKTGFIPTTIPTVFKQLREKGILIGIASGRGIFGVVPEIRDLKPDFFVTLNGAYIEDKKVRSFISIRLKSQMLRSISLGLSKKELSMAWLGVMMPSCRLAPI
ncbi:HAD superfamily hydrolase [Streptococcus pneumoniae]|nr:HAD superfamily hydrolase [Streptococcus pneumoniae]